MLDPDAFDTFDDFKKALMAEGLKNNWTPIVIPTEEAMNDILAHKGGEMSTIEIVDNVLEHFGAKGMKWGVRKESSSGSQAVSVKDKGKKIKTSGGKGHPTHPDALRAHRLGQVAKKSGTKALSNQDLQDYTKRLQLETSLKGLNKQQQGNGKKAANSILKQAGNKAVQEITGGAMKLVKSHLLKTFK